LEIKKIEHVEFYVIEVISGKRVIRDVRRGRNNN